MLRRSEPRKSSCPPRSSGANTQKAKGLPRKRTTADRSGSGSGGSVVKPLRHRQQTNFLKFPLTRLQELFRKKRGSSLISYSRKFRNSKKGHPYKQSPQLLTYILPIARAKGELTYSCGPRGKKDVGIFLHVQWKLSPTTVA
jgi:hypothetical protein